MTTANNHLLQKVTFEIGLASQDGAFEIQNRISNAFRSGVLRELEKLFDRKSIPGTVISIDKIEINLGNLSSARLEEDIVTAFERELDGFLATLNEEVSRAETASFTESKIVNVRWSVPGNPQFEAEVTVSDNSVSHYQKVIQLLETGVLPGSDAVFESQKFSGLIHLVLEQHPEQFVQFLKLNKGNPKIFQRLALNLPVPQLQYLVSMLGCSFSADAPALVREVIGFFTDSKITIRDFTIPGSITFTSTEQFIWWLMLLKYTGEVGPAVTAGAEINAAQSRLRGYTGSDKVSLLTEIIFLSERLSQRSIIQTTGSSYSKKHLSAEFTEALTLVHTGLTNNSSASQPTTDNIHEFQGEPVTKEPSILSDSTSLLQNTLFTLPDKSEIAALFKESGNEQVPGADTGIYISNAGLIILAPYFRHFFSNLGLLNGKEFASREAAWKAIHLVQHACGFKKESGEEGWSEHELVFNKLICGVPIQDPVPETMELTEQERTEVVELLQAVISNWTIMSRSSVFALQSTFLQKKGRLSKTGNDWELLVERDSAVEILIDKLPWGISMIKLPWNVYTIHTQW